MTRWLRELSAPPIWPCLAPLYATLLGPRQVIVDNWQGGDGRAGGVADEEEWTFNVALITATHF